MKFYYSMPIMLIMLLVAATSAQAHFQLIYTPESALQKPEKLQLRLIFTHPFDAGHTMDMPEPEEFYVLHKGQKTDLMQDLQPIKWQGAHNSGQAFATDYSLRGMGDWVFALKPEPYYEEKEEVYIQQITKTVVNVKGLPTDWDTELGLKAEIVPLDKPYALWTGNVFRGVVKADGQPVPNAQIEVEYLNHEPKIESDSFAKQAKVEAPQAAFETMTIKANEHGEFSFGIPKAGWWGFCALGVGPDDQYEGKELSQDAVIWVQARDME
ncbi:MAG: DUF4198 domain-containing protein [Desulfohalobiaceae bacterium]